MRNKVAKRLRKKIYGDLAHDSDLVRKQTDYGFGTILNIGRRHDYQEAKKKHLNRNKN